MIEALRTQLEKVIAGTMYPSNPDMSGDPSRRLLPHQKRAVEDCALAVLEEFQRAAPGAEVIVPWAFGGTDCLHTPGFEKECQCVGCPRRPASA